MLVVMRMQQAHEVKFGIPKRCRDTADDADVTCASAFRGQIPESVTWLVPSGSYFFRE